MPGENSPIVTENNPAPVESPIVTTPEPIEVVLEPTATLIPVADILLDTQPKATPEWAQKRINELTAKRYEAERLANEAADRASAAELRNKELLAQIDKTVTPINSSQTSEEEIEKRALEKAQKIAMTHEFNKTCNNIVEIGKKEFKDWDEAVKNLTMVGAIGEKVSSEFLETAIELKDPHKILHYLGTHMDEGARVAALSPKRMAVELARIEAVLNAPPPPTPVAPPAPISNAPAPLIPLGGAAKPGTPSIDDPDLSAADWMALRAKEIEEKRMRYRRN